MFACSRRLVAHEPVDHRLRHLARRRVVEKDQRLAVDLELEDREIGADALDVERSALQCLQCGLMAVMRVSSRAAPVCAITALLQRARPRERTGMRSMTAAPNA